MVNGLKTQFKYTITRCSLEYGTYSRPIMEYADVDRFADLNSIML